ncbi:hypothetical protein HN014_06880 [Aquimarina sp. TRL1]|uniref:MbnP family protein n=1 Tax=Aquimarina sp. (strain TRL1) TaxID=2736252 RepID=UPI001589872F|nr:MbnP family protein [Aquimarina sp. TRL1]QKX04648.1 hypothetical protein HN014_06880 [Aquimarina sp. TRL1]
MKNFFLIALLAVGIVSCKSDDDSTTDLEPGALTINVSNVIDGKNIELNNTSYTNKSNETYKIAELKYIISNIVLIKENGDKVAYPVEKSYFLINEEVDASKKIALSDIEGGVYTKISFGFGVDQSNYPLNGVNNFIPTAEENNMLWSWSAGYKFLKFEGTYNENDGPEKEFVIHVGSHGTTLDNYKEVTVNLTQQLTINKGTTPAITLNADISKIFDGTNTHSLTVKSDIQIDPENAPKIAENVSKMFTAESK